MLADLPSGQAPKVYGLPSISLLMAVEHMHSSISTAHLVVHQCAAHAAVEGCHLLVEGIVRLMLCYPSAPVLRAGVLHPSLTSLRKEKLQQANIALSFIENTGIRE